MTSPSRHTDMVSKIASKLWDRIKLIKRSLWILSPKAARSSQTGSPLTFNLMRNIFTVTFWKRVSDPIQHSGVRHWAIYLSVLPIWTWRAKCVHATPTFYLLSKFRLLLVFYFHLCFCSSKFLIGNKYQMEMERICMVVPCSHDTCYTQYALHLRVTGHPLTQLQLHFTHDLPHWLVQQVILTMRVGFKTSNLSLPVQPPKPSPVPNT